MARLPFLMRLPHCQSCFTTESWSSKPCCVLGEALCLLHTCCISHFTGETVAQRWSNLLKEGTEIYMIKLRHKLLGCVCKKAIKVCHVASQGVTCKPVGACWGIGEKVLCSGTPLWQWRVCWTWAEFLLLIPSFLKPLVLQVNKTASWTSPSGR